MAKNNDYRVHRVYCYDIDYEILILEIPEGDLEDKLAYFAKEKGSIPKEYYDDYIVATCVANINQVLHKIGQDDMTNANPLNLAALKDKIIGMVLEKNGGLKYTRVIINKNNVLKIKKENAKLVNGERWLSDNKGWNLSSIDENEDEAILEALDDELDADNDIPNISKNIEDLEYVIEKKFWKRLRKYIEVKKFDEEDLPNLLKNRFFHNRVSFNTFVVTICVVDFEGLFATLDTMGIPARVAPPLLMQELYDLCQNSNPFLTFDNVQKYSIDKDDTSEDCPTNEGTCKSTGSGSTMGNYTNKSNKKKKKFKDVPKEDLLNLANSMKVSLIGQDKAIDSLVEAIQRASVGLKDPSKPIGSFLLAGTTGCGKTLTSKVLANELIKDRKNLITIDCSEYSADHEYSKLIGAPSGYIGYENGGILTNAILKKPFSVVVFDEIEKASTKVFQLLLQILEEGRLTDNKGTAVPFKDTVIIMTSNIGVEEINSIGKTIGFGDVSEITTEKKEKAIEGALKKKFKPEFINRIGDIIYFNDLKKEDYYRIIDIELYKLNDNLQANDTEYKALTLDFDKKLKNLIFDNGINDEYGARPLKRSIEKLVSAPLAIKLLSENIEKDAVVKVSAKKGKADFTIKVKVVDPPFYLDASHKVVD